MASLTLFSTSEALELRIILELLRVIGRFLTGRAELKEARVKRREEKAFRSDCWWGVGITAIFLLYLYVVPTSSRSLNMA